MIRTTILVWETVTIIAIRLVKETVILITSRKRSSK